METVTIAISWKLAVNPRAESIATVARGTTFAELLLQLGHKPDANNILLVYNGRTAFLMDPINENGQITILPMLCGG